MYLVHKLKNKADMNYFNEKYQKYEKTKNCSKTVLKVKIV